jgi:hypothetical protein
MTFTRFDSVSVHEDMSLVRFAIRFLGDGKPASNSQAVSHPVGLSCDLRPAPFMS